MLACSWDAKYKAHRLDMQILRKYYEYFSAHCKKTFDTHG